MSGKIKDEKKGVGLRLSKKVIAIYEQVAHRANGLAISNNLSVRYTSQDVMRRQLEKMPVVRMALEKDSENNGHSKPENNG